MPVTIKSSGLSGSEQVLAGYESSLEAAIGYHSHGFAPIPLKHKSKKPACEWTKFIFDPEIAVECFDNGKGVALKLGHKFGGLVDVDLDCAEARKLAHDFLENSECVFGRYSAHGSHWMYRTETPFKTIKFQVKLNGKDSVFLELRGHGHLTMVPPSMHPSGETIRFEEGKAAFPELTDIKKLQQSASLLAVASCLVRVWPKTNGGRQDFAMALAGGMSHAGFDALYVKKFIHTVAKAAGDEEADKRAEAAIDTASKLDGGKQITGWPTLAELIGIDGNGVITKFKKWLGVKESEGTFLGQGTPIEAKLKITVADQIKTKKIEWFWPGLVPRGAITIIDGDPGMGKSTVTLDLAARQSTGDDLPDGSPCSPGNVLILSAEDDAATTIIPRLKAADADTSRVHIVHDELVDFNGDCRALSLLSDIGQLGEIVAVKNAKMLIIDPFVAFLGGKVSPNDDQRIRMILSPIRAMAEHFGVAVILVRHLNKKEGISVLYRGGGSIGIVGAARSGLLVGKPSDDPETRILAVSKTNLATKPIAWRYRLISKFSDPNDADSWEAGAIEWMGETDVTATQLVATPKGQKTSAIEGAIEFIKEVLSNDSMPSAKIMTLAKEAGHAAKTVNRAAKEIGVIKEQVHQDGKISGWIWSLPGNEDQDDQDEQ